MYTVSKFPHGTFSWADCQSTNQAKSRDFLKALFGWGSDEFPMGNDMTYTMFQNDGMTVAALNQMQPDMAKQGIPSHWNNYVTVDDVDAVAGKVTELGGTLIAEPFDVFDNGRMLVLQDPMGAMLSLWQAKNHIGAQLINTAGAMIWNELVTPDVEKAKEFYGQLLGWKFQKDDNMDYHYIVNNGRMNGGILPLIEDMENTPPVWMVYFNVADIDVAVERVESNGGQVHVPITEIPVGKFAVIADPAGAVMTIMQANQAQEWDVE